MSRFCRITGEFTYDTLSILNYLALYGFVEKLAEFYPIADVNFINVSLQIPEICVNEAMRKNELNSWYFLGNQALGRYPLNYSIYQ